MKSKPTRRDLLVTIGQLQGHIGDALAWIDNDRSHEAKPRIRAALETAHAICIEATSCDPPAEPPPEAEKP